MTPTETIRVDCDASLESAVARAITVLSRGGLVAVPTETVYGLAANARDPEAVAKIFAAKGRPATNPVIAHVPNVEAARALVSEWPESASLLARAFWPGPLTIVLAKRIGAVAEDVTAGGPTVAIRVPSHPLLSRILNRIDFPLAAPSANRSESISPTTAEHVLASLDGRVDLVLDAGPTARGIESTVIDLAGPVRLLRPGPITRDQIEGLIGPLNRAAEESTGDGVARSPGMMKRHYAPKTSVEVSSDPARAIHRHRSTGRRVAWIALVGDVVDPECPCRVMAADPIEYQRDLYAALHWADEQEAELIIVTAPPVGDAWEAIHDRLRRASAFIGDLPQFP
ncbi:MAG: L-threonylcarbamoyladenylate synthase [Planctomycetota bacterium]